MKIALKDPNLGYLGNFLWLPRDSVPESLLREKLRFVVPAYRGNQSIVYTLWDMCGAHVRVPRHFPFISPGLEIVDIRPKEYTPIDFEDRLESFLDARQESAFEAIKPVEEGILNLACGRGKTLLGIKKAVLNNGPFLVIVYDTSTFKQWALAIRRYTDYRGPIGTIQGNKMDWKKPVVFASIHTLAQRPYLPPEVSHWYRTIILDEIHHTGADTLKRVLPKFWGSRIGLTATVNRQDGLDELIYQHVGPVFWEDMWQPLKPIIFFKNTNVEINIRSKHIRDRTGEVNMAKMVRQLSKLDSRNNIIIEEVEKARAADRRLLVLAHNVSHVKMLSSIVEGSAYISGEISPSRRAHIFKSHTVVFGTLGVAKEALDAPDLDMVVFATPFKNWAAFQQGMGRALRDAPGKKQPIVIMLYDIGVKPAAAMCRSIMRTLKTKGFDYSVVR